MVFLTDHLSRPGNIRRTALPAAGPGIAVMNLDRREMFLKPFRQFYIPWYGRHAEGTDFLYQSHWQIAPAILFLMPPSPCASASRSQTSSPGERVFLRPFPAGKSIRPRQHIPFPISPEGNLFHGKSDISQAGCHKCFLRTVPHIPSHKGQTAA